MSLDTAYRHFEDAAAQALDWLSGELRGLRTGRVQPDLVANLPVDHYGTRTPLQGLASVANSDARTLVITPWDPGATAAIAKTLTAAQLGVQPIIDGHIIRLSFPTMTQEVREQTIKQLHQKAEEARVRLRQGRDEALAMIKNEKQAVSLTEDDFYDGKRELDQRISKANATIADIVNRKEAEISSV